MWNTIADVAVAFVYPVSTGDDGERTYVKFESPGPAFGGGGGGIVGGNMSRSLLHSLLTLTRHTD